jgi:hypothetical protein
LEGWEKASWQLVLRLALDPGNHQEVLVPQDPERG